MSNIRINAPRSSDPFQVLSDPARIFPKQEQVDFVQSLLTVLRGFLSGVATKDRAVPQIILSAPNGSSWIVTVNDAGQLQTRNARA